MYIQCPSCETVFDLPEIEKSNKKYKCSVCQHTWLEKSNYYVKKKVAQKNRKSNFNKIIILNTVILLLVLFAFIFFREHLESIDSYWKNLYLFFDALIPI